MCRVPRPFYDSPFVSEVVSKAPCALCVCSAFSLHQSIRTSSIDWQRTCCVQSIPLDVHVNSRCCSCVDSIAGTKDRTFSPSSIQIPSLQPSLCRFQLWSHACGEGLHCTCSGGRWEVQQHGPIFMPPIARLPCQSHSVYLRGEILVLPFKIDANRACADWG